MRMKVIATGSGRLQRLVRRWGVSFLLGDGVIFDTFGDPDVFIGNARRFAIDLSKISHIVLSHDDWDHVSGLWEILPNRRDITVHVCPGFSAGIKERISSFGVNLIESDRPTRVYGNIFTTGELRGDPEGRRIYEQSVAVRTPVGFSVICGCAHPGVDNIVRKAEKELGAAVDTLIGGFHMKDSTDEANDRVIENLKSSGVRRIMPMHCTGDRAVRAMRRAFGRGFKWLKEGDDVEL